ADAEALFAVIRRLRDQRVGVIYISHRLEEVFALADRATVLKDGAGQGTFPVAGLTPRDLMTRMVGREVNPHQPRPDPPTADGKVVLEVRGLGDDPARPGPRPRLSDVSFTARAGEVVALAGMVGAGRTELALALFGARPGVHGEVRVDGRPVKV